MSQHTAEEYLLPKHEHKVKLKAEFLLNYCEGIVSSNQQRVVSSQEKEGIESAIEKVKGELTHLCEKGSNKGLAVSEIFLVAEDMEPFLKAEEKQLVHSPKSNYYKEGYLYALHQTQAVIDRIF